MMNKQTNEILQSYETAIKNLNSSNIEDKDVLDILHTRDVLEIAFKEEKCLSSSILKTLISCDIELRNKAGIITKSIKAESFENWRHTVHPPAEAWWWNLEAIAPHPWDNWDWLWKLLSLAGWTLNISLLVNISTRFLVGGGVGLVGVGAVALPSILTLLQANSQLTKFGEQGFSKLLNQKIPILNRKIPKEYHQEIKLGSTFIMSGFLIGFWFSLPIFSNFYHRNGLYNFDNGNLTSAEQNFQRAIHLNTNNIAARYNLANLYEEWEQITKAKQQYQIAIAANLPSAYNNLARLHIKDKKYPEAAVLLTKGLNFATQANFQKPEVRYSLFKNLGWVRFEQARYENAVSRLKTAIAISQNPQVRPYIPNPAAAHCLLALALEKQQQSAKQILPHWQQCAALGSVTNADEDGWLHIARQKLSQKNTQNNK